MSIALLLEMAVSVNPDRLAVISGEEQWTTKQLSDIAGGGSGVIADSDVEHVVYVGVGGAILPALLFAAAKAACGFTPVNYRLSVEVIAELIDRLPRSLVVVDTRYLDAIGDAGSQVISSEDFLRTALATPCADRFADPTSTAVVLYTSGTTSKPKAVELSHLNLSSYITGTVEFDGAGTEDAALICVPPYHIAGVTAAMSNLYAGRRMVYLPTFDAVEWVRLAAAEKVTSATLVPTMLDRVVTALEEQRVSLPALRSLAYGGSRVGLPLVRRALALLPHVGFVNAYGLTETSSTISILTPDDHRIAMASDEDSVGRRLGSVGRPVPGIEIEVRADDGQVVGPGQRGELWVRGEQVSGTYTGIGSKLDEQGWFPTADIAEVDDDGYLFIGGRSDDTIIRGGENIAPAEVEDVLIEHPHVRDVAVIGIEDPEWGQAIVAVVVPMLGADPDPEALREYVRAQLRGSRTPDRVVFRAELPTNPTGKVLRRELVASLQHEQR
ncbi:class I adenylate-forming enzyme family protein [Mycolicibacterium sp. P9-22]|uniref:class I adenylate-forming enzyme family protein n=1 Tax=Mycolicibacterium sp. P9-22 TaxID=2024613 RepID=UPI0011EBE2BB|nr:fatty acid--CoA ligase family protein [Mycolicibacterium sp. P9-22]KAA0109988.1 long-chain fatty acid--CoA ligase [Mycolicibacterium sp. P9-22]